MKHDTSGKPCPCNPKTIKVFGVAKGEGKGEFVVGDGENIVAVTGKKSHANLFADTLNDVAHGKTAIEWFKLHEAMRFDFNRLLEKA